MKTTTNCNAATATKTATTNPDSILVQAYIGGDKNAINKIVEKHKPRILGYILSMVKNTAIADDIFQDTIIKVIASIDKGKYNDDGKLISWILRVAHNQVIDYFRATKRKKEVKATDGNIDSFIGALAPEIQNSGEATIIENQTNQQLKKLVDTLPKEQKEVVVMRHFMNLSFSEIAEQTGVSINTALGRMRYALINLRKNVDQYNLELI